MKRLVSRLSSLVSALAALAAGADPAGPAWGAAAAIRLEHAVAAEVAESLNGLFTNQAVRPVEVLADKRDNSVLLFARDQHDLDTMRKMVADLDIAPSIPEDAEAAARAEGERLARESATFVPADPDSRLAPARRVRFYCPDGFAEQLYSVPWMESASAEYPYLVPTNTTAVSPPGNPKGLAVLAFARELGADIPDGSVANYIPTTSKLFVFTSPAAQTEIEQLLAVLSGASCGRVEIAASVLAVADADLDSFLSRFGVPAEPAALLAPVLARRPSLDNLRDLAESPPAADLAPSFGDDHLRMKPDGIARRTVGNDECAELASITEYIFASTFRWGGTDVPASDGGTVSNRAVIIRDPQDFQTRPVGPQFRVVPRLRPGDDRIHLAVRFEYTGHPVWAGIPSAGVPLRRADGSYAMVRSGYVEGNPPWFCGGEMPEFPSFVEECALDLADGEAALLRPFPDPNAPADAPRFFVPVVSARRSPDPVQEAHRAPGSRLLTSQETGARRRAIVEDGFARRWKGDRE